MDVYLQKQVLTEENLTFHFGLGTSDLIDERVINTSGDLFGKFQASFLNHFASGLKYSRSKQ
jgi:hypothetical protein